VLGVVVSLTTLVAVAWPWWCARAIEARLQSWVRASDPDGEWVWRQLVHERGWLRSQGSVELVVRARCSPDPALRQGGVLRLNYALLHWPTWQSASQFSWQLRPADSAQGQLIRRLLGTTLPATGEGTLGWDRSLHSSFHLPAWRLEAAQSHWRGAPSHGELHWNEDGLKLQAKVGQWRAQHGDGAITGRSLSLSLNLPMAPNSLGDLSLQLADLRGDDWQLQGLSVDTQIRRQGAHLSTKWRQRVQRLQWREWGLRDLQLDFALREIDQAGSATLAGLFSQSCRLERLADRDAQRWLAAWRRVLSHGLKLDVSQVAGHINGRSGQVGRVQGRWSLGLLPSPATGPLHLVESLVSQGELSIQGDVLPPTLHDSALASGYFRATAEGLQGHYSYAQGRLSVAGQTEALPHFQALLNMLDKAIPAWLTPTPATPQPENREPDLPPPSVD
jgi:hypothetical protein